MIENELTFYKPNVMLTITPPIYIGSSREPRILMNLVPPKSNNQKGYEWASRISVNLRMIEIASILNVLEQRSERVKCELYHSVTDHENSTILVSYEDRHQEITIAVSKTKDGKKKSMVIKLDGAEQVLIKTIFRYDLPRMRMFKDRK